MLPALETISITDFRSVRGTVSVPLGAEIVLLHGVNGAGKSTVMSAIEFALTGDMSDLRPDDRRHLVHRGAQLATVALASIGATNSLTLSLDGEVSGKPLLSLDDSRFLAERSYLRQRTLGRLLEVYEASGSRGESPLTAFVKELLGLDELDELIDGLDPVGDLRRLRNAVPEYRQAEGELERANERLGQLSDALRDADDRAASTRAQLTDALELLDAPPTLREEPDGVVAWLETQRQQQSLVALVEARQELAGMERRLSKLAPVTPGQDAEAARKAAASARSAADAWWRSTGAELEAVLNELRNDLPALPSAASADPAEAHASALKQLGAERDRLSSALAGEEAAVIEQTRLEAEIASGQARVSAIDEQIAASHTMTAADELGKALAGLIPHVHDDNCPVCGRTFSEVSNQPLVAHLAAKISELGHEAERLQALSRARIEALEDVRQLQEQRAALAGRRVGQRLSRSPWKFVAAVRG